MPLPEILRRKDKRDAPTPAKDRLGVYPTEADVPPLPDRRAMWTARAAMVFATAQTFLSLSLVWVIIAMQPLKEVIPYLITVSDSSKQIVTVRRAGVSMTDAQLLAEAVAREYVINRATIGIDNAEQARLWGPKGYVATRSTPDEYGRFQKAIRAQYIEFRKQHQTREVLVRSVKTISPGYITVEVDYVDRDDSESVIGTSSWTASLTYGFSPSAVTYEDRWVNPLGFRVTDFSITTRTAS